MGKTGEELFKQREKRIQDATQLKTPDRVPIMPFDNGWCLKYAGVSWKEALYEPEKGLEACKKAVIELNWDAFNLPWATGAVIPVSGFDILDVQQLMWPGARKEANRVSTDSVYQFAEPGTRGKYEPMPPEDYDLFLDDPTDYLIRRWWPRITKALEPLEELIPVHLAESAYVFPLLLGSPKIVQVLRTLLEASEEFAEANALLGSFVTDMVENAFPPMYLTFSLSPYDFLADIIRGTEGCMIDMFRRPEKLKEAINKVTPYCIEMGLLAKQSEDLCKRIFIPVHKGAGGLMSNEQFEEFWWPSMREVMVALIDEGFTPYLYTEGIYTDRLPIIKDIPRGKAIYHIESDIFKAKEILGDTVCLTGGPPAAMMNAGTPQQVADYTKKLIDVIGEGGGFMMDAEVPLITAKVENIEAMTKTVMKYGVY
jgi:hypothetical protein